MKTGSIFDKPRGSCQLDKEDAVSKSFQTGKNHYNPFFPSTLLG